MKTPPTIVTALAKKFGAAPLDWRITETTVIIVFENGQKVPFEKEAAPEHESSDVLLTQQEDASPDLIPSPAKDLPYRKKKEGK